MEPKLWFKALANGAAVRSYIRRPPCFYAYGACTLLMPERIHNPYGSSRSSHLLFRRQSGLISVGQRGDDSSEIHIVRCLDQNGVAILEDLILSFQKCIHRLIVQTERLRVLRRLMDGPA